MAYFVLPSLHTVLIARRYAPEAPKSIPLKEKFTSSINIGFEEERESFSSSRVL
ncbi:hypothetical protein GCM10007359_17780 [Rothia aerolata]|uniref:Uncharacterized protein n=1 Tax=Rothia aerolata TaxID=1812262 RepID=A0A917IXY9_9MICC|nr:hypothetical protein GCM10007359_17780 [Rothia aerolata]